MNSMIKNTKNKIITVFRGRAVLILLIRKTPGPTISIKGLECSKGCVIDDGYSYTFYSFPNKDEYPDYYNISYDLYIKTDSCGWKYLGYTKPSGEYVRMEYEWSPYSNSPYNTGFYWKLINESTSKNPCEFEERILSYTKSKCYKRWDEVILETLVEGEKIISIDDCILVGE